MRIGGVPIVQRTLSGLRASSRIDRIVAVAPPSAAAHPALAGASEVRGDGARMFESLRSGMQGFTEDALVIVAASDLPALDAPAVDEFVDAVLARDLDVAYACLERRYHDALYPEFPHTWARMRDGRFCGGGLVALRPRALPRLSAFMDALGARASRRCGWPGCSAGTSWRASRSAGCASSDAEARASRLLAARVGAIRCTQPQIALNVDRVEDVARANARFRVSENLSRGAPRCREHATRDSPLSSLVLAAGAPAARPGARRAACRPSACTPRQANLGGIGRAGVVAFIAPVSRAPVCATFANVAFDGYEARLGDAPAPDALAVAAVVPGGDVTLQLEGATLAASAPMSSRRAARFRTPAATSARRPASCWRSPASACC